MAQQGSTLHDLCTHWRVTCSSPAGARALMGKGDGGKKGPPPIVCKKTPGPKGVNIVCN